MKIQYSLYLLLLFTIPGCCWISEDEYAYDYDRPPEYGIYIELGDSGAKISEIYYPAPLNIRQQVNAGSALVKQTALYDSMAVIITSDLGIDTMIFSRDESVIWMSKCKAEQYVPMFDLEKHTFDSLALDYYSDYYGELYRCY